VVVVESTVWANNGHLYNLLANQSATGGNTGLSWTDAENYAVSNGGHLATVDFADTQDWIWSQFGSANYNYWIGLTDRVNEGVYLWIGTGLAPLTPIGIRASRNDFNNEDYTLVLRSGFSGGNGPGGGKWNDYQDTTFSMMQRSTLWRTWGMPFRNRPHWNARHRRGITGGTAPPAPDWRFAQLPLTAPSLLSSVRCGMARPTQGRVRIIAARLVYTVVPAN